MWLHTLRARATPEFRELGWEMWRQLRRGRPSAPEVLFRLLQVPLADVIEESWRAPDDLDADEAHNLRSLG